LWCRRWGAPRWSRLGGDPGSPVAACPPPIAVKTAPTKVSPPQLRWSRLDGDFGYSVAAYLPPIATTVIPYPALPGR